MKEYILNTFYDDNDSKIINIFKLFNKKKIFIYSVYDIDELKLIEKRQKDFLFFKRKYYLYQLENLNLCDYIFNDIPWIELYITSKDIHLDDLKTNNNFLNEDDIKIYKINEEITISVYSYNLYLKIKNIIENE